LIPVGSSVEVVEDESGQSPAETPFRLTYFGFVWQGRNIETLLRALAAVVPVRPDAVLDVVGGIRGDAYLHELQALAERLGVADRVTFTGDWPSTQISGALRRAHVALLPFTSGVSTGRTTLMAALAHRLPVVTYGVAENLSAHFRHEDNMMIAPQGDEAAFIAQVCRLAEDPALRLRLASGASELTETFSWPRIAAQVLSLPSYREITPVGLQFPGG
jgi:glycosyltransferase involved in cell wall biosynthesis